ncbi:type VII secretion target [Saccharopolyspora sp. NPDC000359]|uniref:type VII secretion target n=1 Tax=Saccharopolyspora sp. NPDC000359 TaxID=3154251 RepID=UPI0033210503
MTFQVEAEDLTAHASHLDGLSDRFDTAIDAAQQAMSDDAYGLLCSFLPPIINPMEEEGLEALKAAKEGVSTTADNVRQTAKEYQEVDQAGADNFSQFDDAVRVDDSSVALRGVLPVGGPEGGATVPASAPEQGSEPLQATYRNAAPAQEAEPAQVYRSAAPARDAEPAQFYRNAAPAQEAEPAQVYRAAAPAQEAEPAHAYRSAAADSGPIRTTTGEVLTGDVPTLDEYDGQPIDPTQYRRNTEA